MSSSSAFRYLVGIPLLYIFLFPPLSLLAEKYPAEWSDNAVLYLGKPYLWLSQQPVISKPLVDYYVLWNKPAEDGA